MQATLSAGHSGIGYKRARDIAPPAQMRALIAAKPRIQAMILDAVAAGLLLKQPLESRLAAVIETATYLEALDEDVFRKRPRRQTKRGSKQMTGTTGPSLRTRQCQNSSIPVRLLKMMTARRWIFLSHLGRKDSVHRGSKFSFHGCLIEPD